MVHFFFTTSLTPAIPLPLRTPDFFFTALLLKQPQRVFQRTQMRLTELITSKESESLEFKSSLRWDYNTSAVSKKVE
jgi:hypothetical protein